MESNLGHTFSQKNESALLCSCIIDPELAMIKCLSAKVSVEWFYTIADQLIWTSLTSLYERGVEIDEVTLGDDLMAKGELDRIGGHAGITHLARVVETAGHVNSYIDIVLRCYTHRRVIRLSRGLMEDAIKPADDIKSIKSNIQSCLVDLNNISIQEKDEGLIEVADEMIAQAVREFNGEPEAVDKSRWITWGLKDIDASFGPMNPDRRDNLVVVAGRPGHGKSALSTQVALENVLAGKTVVIFTLETTREDILRQMASIMAQINTRYSFDKLRRDSKYGPDRVRKYVESLKKLRELCEDRLFIFEDDMELGAIDSRISEIKSRVGRIDLIVVDYLQLVEVNDGIPREQQVSKASRRFKVISKGLNCVLMLNAQLNRDFSEETGPALKNLRESGAIEQDADRVIFTWRPDKDANGNRQDDREDFQQKLVQAKMKNGPRLWRWVIFRPTTTTFKSVPPEEHRGRPKGS